MAARKVGRQWKQKAAARRMTRAQAAENKDNANTHKKDPTATANESKSSDEDECDEPCASRPLEARGIAVPIPDATAVKAASLQFCHGGVEFLCVFFHTRCHND